MSDDPQKPGLPEHLLPLLKEALSEDTSRGINNVLDKEADALKTGRMGRAFKLSSLAMRSGGRLLMSKTKEKLKGQAQKAANEKLAVQMLKTFSEMRGVTMKMGQMLSYLDQSLPPEAQKVLALLQRDVPPMPYERAQQQFQESMGKPPEDIYATFEQTPIAAASIGQVHRATLHDGTEVAVKIQYPGIEAAMSSDLKNAKFMSLFQQMFFFRTDTKALMAELEERFMDECDYEKEAHYQNAYLERFRGHPNIVVPEVYEEYCSKRVLTTKMEHGLGFYQWLENSPSQEARQKAVQSFYRFYIGALYMDGLFNCDPHPGNYLFREDGRIVFLDYGCCRRFSEERLKQWMGICQAVSRDDEAQIRSLAVELGFVQSDDSYDWPSFRELMRYLYLPHLEDKAYDFTAYDPSVTFKRMFVENPNLFKLNMPADSVFLNRITFGLVSLLAQIGEPLNIYQRAESYFQGVDPDWPEDPVPRNRLS